MPDIDRLRRLAIDGDPEATAEYARWMIRRGDGRASCAPPLPPPPVTRPTPPWGAIHREKCASFYRVFGVRRSMRCQTPAGPTGYVRRNCPGYRRDCVNVLAPVTLPWSLRCDLPDHRTKAPSCVSWNPRDCLPVLGHLFNYRLPSRTEEATP